MKLKISYVLLSVILCSNFALAKTSNLPVPDTVSPYLQQNIAVKNNSWNIPLKTEQQWHAFIDGVAVAGAANSQKMAEHFNVSIDEGYIDNVHTYTLTPPEIAPENQDKVILFLHGGGYVLNPGISGISEGVMLAGIGKYKVISVDYRMAPQHPYPAAIDDAFKVYKKLLKDYASKDIGVYGTSTGGGMTLILTMMARDNGLPVPGAIVPSTPWSDLTKTGDSYFANEKVDNVLVSYDGWLSDAVRVYAQGNDLKDPYLSPVYGDVNSFPPTLLISGTRDLFLSNTVRMQQKLIEKNIPNNLIIYEGQSHCQYYLGLPPDAPELQNHYRNVSQFFNENLGK